MVSYSYTMPEKVSFKTGLSLPPTLHKRALARSQEVAGGKFSRYVQQLIRADVALEPTPTAHDPEIVDKLTRTYVGYLAPQFKDAMARRQIDQPRLLAGLLVASFELLERLPPNESPYGAVLELTREWFRDHPLVAAEGPQEPYKSSAPTPPLAHSPVPNSGHPA